MVQEIFNKTLAERELRINPKVKNKALYALSNAITDNQKTIVRKLKAKIKKSTNISPGPSSKKTNKLSSDDLERRLINALDRQPDNANLLGKAIDFFIKVKDKASEMEEEIDIKELLNLGIVKKFND